MCSYRPRLFQVGSRASDKGAWSGDDLGINRLLLSGLGAVRPSKSVVMKGPYQSLGHERGTRCHPYHEGEIGQERPNPSTSEQLSEGHCVQVLNDVRESFCYDRV